MTALAFALGLAAGVAVTILLLTGAAGLKRLEDRDDSPLPTIRPEMLDEVR